MKMIGKNLVSALFSKIWLMFWTFHVKHNIKILFTIEAKQARNILFYFLTFEAFLTVDNLWAITITVLLFIALSIASCTKCSLSASKALVAYNI